jgi:flavin reductase (DIM6/NTAB) family NADH-FMN oxidoreductase RutF
MASTQFNAEEIEKLDKQYRTQLINSLTGFKSLALIGTADVSGKTNLSLFSQIFHVGAHPPLIGLLSRPNTVPRHTLENILEKESFTINHVKSDFYEQAHATSARWDVSEFAVVGLHEEYLDSFSVPFVKESHIKLGCELREVLDIQSNGTHLLIGEIKLITLDDSFLEDDGFVDLEAAGTITVSGLDSYHHTSKIGRLPYAKPIKK